MILQEEAIELLDSEAPIDTDTNSPRIRLIELRAEGYETEQIAEILNMSATRVRDMEDRLIEEFLS